MALRAVGQEALGFFHRHRLKGDFAPVLIGRVNPRPNSLGAPISVHYEPLGICRFDGRFPVFWEQVLREDAHICHGHDKILTRVVYSDVLSSSAPGMLCPVKLLHISRIKPRGFQSRENRITRTKCISAKCCIFTQLEHQRACLHIIANHATELDLSLTTCTMSS